MYLFLLTLITLLAFQLVQLLYVISQSLAGILAGTKVLCNSIGAGPVLYKMNLFNIEWRLSLFPFNAYTKFVGEEDLLEESFFLTEDDSIQPFTALPFYSQTFILLAGPCSTILVGLLLLWTATFFEGSNVVVAPNTGEQIFPSAVPELAWEKSQADWKSHIELLQDTILTFATRLITFQSLTGWGGALGSIITCAVVLAHSPPAWLTCFGIICFAMGVLNLLPIPVFNGGFLLIYFLKFIIGRELESLIHRVNLGGIIFCLFVWLRIIYRDIVWSYSQFL